jgi:hypothetical protein
VREEARLSIGGSDGPVIDAPVARLVAAWQPQE